MTSACELCAADGGELLKRFFQTPRGSGELQDFLERFGPEDFGSSGAGSGVVIEQRDGWAYALTNAHVLDDSPRAIVRVTYDDWQTSQGTFDIANEFIIYAGQQWFENRVTVDGAEKPVNLASGFARHLPDLRPTPRLNRWMASRR